MKPFLEALRERILMTDGSIGAELYARGIFVNRCFDELVFGEEKLVWQIHQDFFRAGAEALTTNTFGANRVKLASFGLEGKLEAVNKKAVELCKQVSHEAAYVLGAVGPLWRERVAPKGGLPAEQAEEIFAEQARALAAGGADAISLEGFYDLPEILAAIRAAKATGLPVLAHMAFEALGVEGQEIGEPVAVAKQLVHAGADLIGVYNGGGPQPALDTLSEIHEALPDLPLSAKPSTGAPEVQEGRRFLMATPEFMAEMGRRYAQKGARLVGGGDGVTPAMIKDMTDYMRTLSPRHRPLEILEDAAPEVRPLPRVPLAEKGEWGRILAEGKFAVSVELDPPPGLDP
ncbi:MAG: homocysteine S-methyltransferase family protein, partial [Candidatus Methylomirabilis sp.]|nr:homocysteine S-methyltransferase family protein [Deltaproteobacteria bacterium]